MGNPSFFFKDTPFPDMRPTSRTGFFQENRFFEKPALESDTRTELAVLDGNLDPFVKAFLMEFGGK